MYLKLVFVSLPALFIAIFVTFVFVPSGEKMVNNGLLFVSNATKAHTLCGKASKLVRKVLYINLRENPGSTLPVISKQIVNIYSKAVSRNLDVRLMLQPSNNAAKIKTHHPIDVIFYDSELGKEADRLKQSVLALKSDGNMQSIDVSSEEHLVDTPKDSVNTYEYVALGGTFDRLHNGHKILLSQAALRSTKHVTVGVTDINMIKGKKLWELIQPVEVRIKEVLKFLQDINPDLEYSVVPLQDLYGPTKDDPRFQLLVVSEETIKGGFKINEKRMENGLNPLDLYTIGIAQDSQKHEEEEDKVSSSNQRMRLLGTLLKPPVPNPKIPDWPYVIGLAGGIASGKSSIAEKLKLKGAAVVNCDLIAHDLYKPGTALNRTISDTFGSRVVTEDGYVDRKMLGQIVFSDPNKLEVLNNIIWPAILEEARSRIQALGKEGHRVVVMEAAVMVRAKWYDYCHQLWAVIIPPEEAIKRLQKRNNLTEEEAKQRIASQPSNIEQVLPANIVFSPYWSYEYTQTQIDRAWTQLLQYLDMRKHSKM